MDFRCGKHVFNSAHAGPKLLAATGGLLLASSRLASHLSRPGESKYSGCGAHPNQSEGFAWASCWPAFRLFLRRRRLCPPGTHPRSAATWPSRRSALVCVRAHAVRGHGTRSDLLSCWRPRESQAGISQRLRRLLRCPRFQHRTSRGFRGKLHDKPRPCKESCGTLAGAESSAP